MDGNWSVMGANIKEMSSSNEAPKKPRGVEITNFALVRVSPRKNLIWKPWVTFKHKFGPIS